MQRFFYNKHQNLLLIDDDKRILCRNIIKLHNVKEWFWPEIIWCNLSSGEKKDMMFDFIFIGKEVK